MTETIESVRLDGGVTVVATPATFRVHRAWSGEEERLFPGVSAGAGDLAITRQLLAGCVYAGFVERPEDARVVSADRDPFLSYVHYLAGLYQTTRVTSPTMRRVARRFEEEGRTELAARCRRVADEEQGHDRLALEDLDALGVPADALVARLRPAWALELAALLESHADAQPVACFGHAYALERTALMNSAAAVANLASLAPPGVDATRCLRIHSAVGADLTHVKESVSFIAALDASDRTAIARAAYSAACVLQRGRREYPGDDAVRAIVGEARAAAGR
jgi:hypothetical protein